MHFSWHCSCRIYFCCFLLALASIRPWLLVPFFEICFEKRWTRNHPQYLLRLSRPLFPTTFLEIAVFTLASISNQKLNTYLSLIVIQLSSWSMDLGIACVASVFVRFQSNNWSYAKSFAYINKIPWRYVNYYPHIWLYFASLLIC